MAKSNAPTFSSLSNGLLAAVPQREYERLAPHLEKVALVLKAVLIEASEAIPFVYFPLSGVISLLSSSERDDLGVEVGIVGREGMAGLPVFLGMPAAPIRGFVQVPGEALRMRAHDFRRHVGYDCPLHAQLLRYTHTFLAQVSQSVACNSQHPIGKRLCRWLLLMHGYAGQDRFPVTHQFLAALLGVRRATVSVAARKLREARLIAYGGGQMMVLDRKGLETAACGCHKVIQEELDRLSVERAG
jgi:CRP-like cAMP-binding protein